MLLLAGLAIAAAVPRPPCAVPWCPRGFVRAVGTTPPELCGCVTAAACERSGGEPREHACSYDDGGPLRPARAQHAELEERVVLQ